MKKNTLIYKILFLFLGIYILSYFSINHSIAQNSSQIITKVDKDLILKYVNELRKKGCNCGTEYMKPVPPVKWNATLEKAAIIHVKDMNKNEFFDHTGSDGSSPGDRLNRVGYNWSIYGENISWGRANEKDVIDAWIASPGHCKNLMDPVVTEIGVARHGAVWTLVVARSFD